MTDEHTDVSIKVVMPVRDAFADEISAIPRRKNSEGQPLLTLRKPACIIIDNPDGTSSMHLAGYITDTRIRLTSPVMAYDPDTGLVETLNSLYHIPSPPGPTDRYLQKSICMLLIQNAEPVAANEFKKPTIH